VAVLITGLCVVSSLASADADAEREALARLRHEIEALAPLIETAESQASPDARIRFRYDWLRQGLCQVIGIGIFDPGLTLAFNKQPLPSATLKTTVHGTYGNDTPSISDAQAETDCGLGYVPKEIVALDPVT
jgi:RAQPRD family integrative conjugative element protein